MDSSTGWTRPLRVKHSWKDGTRALLLSPDDLLVRLYAAVPPPRVHQVRYFGVLSSHASLRPEVVSSRGHDDCAHRPPPASGDIPQVESHATVIDTQSFNSFEYLGGGCSYSFWDAIAFDSERVLVSGCYQPMILVKLSDGTTASTSLRGVRLSASSLHDADGAIVLSHDCPSNDSQPGLCRIIETGEMIAIATQGLPEIADEYGDFEPDSLSASAHHFVLGPQAGVLTTVDPQTGSVAPIALGKTITAHSVVGDRLFYAGTDGSGASVVGVFDLMNGVDTVSSFGKALTELVALR